ncbi:MAG: transcription-repair coupling factor [Chloroflexi bacterium]|nr:transcription-repair coupling factor [Chloroflexota bacterium]
MQALFQLLESLPQYRSVCQSLEGYKRANAQLSKEATPFVVGALWKKLGVPVLILVPRPEEARRLHDQLLTWCGEDNLFHFPETETLPFERLISDAATVHQRIRTLASLSKVAEDPDRAPLIIASVSAVSQKTVEKETFLSACHQLKKGQRIDLDSLLAQWHKMGYQFDRAVEVPGTVSRRGGIVDIFSPNSPLPARIELWGSEIESIRLFEPSTQRSVDMVSSVAIVPAHEILPGLTKVSNMERLIDALDLSSCSSTAKEHLAQELGMIMRRERFEELNFYAGFFSMESLLDHFPSHGLTVFYRPSEIADAAEEMTQRTLHLREIKQGRGELPGNFPASNLLGSELEARLSLFPRLLEVSPWGVEDEGEDGATPFPFSEPPSFWGRLDSFAQEVEGMAAQGQRIVVISHHAQRLKEIIDEQGLHPSLPNSLEPSPPPGSVTIMQGALEGGLSFSLDQGGLTLFTDAEVFGVSRQRRPSRRSSAKREVFLSELTPGDFVVHVDHGIARFAGTTRRSAEAEEKEYLVLDYAEGDRLYVPVEQIGRISPYVAPMERPPTLTRLGTQEWHRITERVKRSAREMASELLSLYAARDVIEGIAFPPDTPWQREIEDSFPYEETPDQLTTIAEVKADMETPRPMDRLVCGDVGYGKTEVALRAAFKAVMDGRQVAVLVPTTVLAQQHYVTFSERLSPFPTTVEVLSRFRTEAEQRQVVEGLAAGRIDICIGTHRLLQKDVIFKNLGLVVVDEEQRFGVAHKERLKQMRKDVDVLTLSATPIPRTLHMSLSGVRDMSTMETPPEERLPIKTYVSEYSDELIRETILREVDRQGQVFFLHNRVHTIHSMADWLRQMVPEATFGVAHGQMPEEQLERVMMDFSQGHLDVLVCTTIIESGLDIPNVNTLIVNRGDMFGLAQLYQLRGRIGRGAHRAYAYFLVPKGKQLTEAAEKRLKTILAATELGAGFRIAMKDLEIRGAGNLLGSEQSGYIHAVGFDLYVRLLAEAVEELRARKGEVKTSRETTVQPSEIRVDIGIPAHLPEEYISDMATRLGIYHRLVRFAELAEVDAMAEELRDRFGHIPLEAMNLLYVVRLRLLAQKGEVESITREDAQIVLRLKDAVGGARPALQKLLGHGVSIGNTQIRLESGSSKDGWQEALQKTLEKLVAFRRRMLAPVDGGRVDAGWE